LFTPDHFQKPSEAEPLSGQLPARGAIEVKSTKDDAQAGASDFWCLRFPAGTAQKFPSGPWAEWTRPPNNRTSSSTLAHPRRNSSVRASSGFYSNSCRSSSSLWTKR
jgi:hypothetical protein